MTIAIVPVKGLDRAKRRLAGGLGPGARGALAKAMLQDVVGALRSVAEIDAIALVTPDDRTARAVHDLGAIRLHDEGGGYSAAALVGLGHALEAGYRRALVLPGDCPLIEPGEIAAALKRVEDDEIGLLVVPDRHGAGTNALVLTPPSAIRPAFGAGSCRRHRELAAAGGVSCRVERLPSLAVDVDTPADLRHLAAMLRGSHAGAERTRRVLDQLPALTPAGTGSSPVSSGRQRLKTPGSDT